MNCVAFSPDGRLVASAGPRKIKIWNTSEGKLLATLSGHTKGTFTLAFSPDGQWLVSGGGDHRVKLWDMTKKREAGAWSLRGIASTVAFTSDGSWLAWNDSFLDDRQILITKINVLDFKAQRPALTLDAYRNSPVSTIVFKQNGKQLAVAGWGGRIELWDPSAGTYVEFSMRGAPKNDLALDKSGRWLITGGGLVEVWDTYSDLAGPCGPDFHNAFSGKDFALLAADISSDGKFLSGATGSIYRPGTTMYIWQRETGQMMRTPEKVRAQATLVRFGPFNGFLAYAGTDKIIRLWDFIDGKEIQHFVGHKGSITDIAFNSNGTMLASTAGFIRAYKIIAYSLPSVDTAVRIWNISSGQQIAMLDRPERHFILDPRLFFPKYFPCSVCERRLAFSPNGRWLASSHTDDLSIWETSKWRLWRQQSTIGTEWTAIEWSPDSNWLVAGTKTGSIDIWDPEKAMVVRTLIGHATQVTGLRFAPKGDWLASSSLDGTVKIWNPRTGELKATLISMTTPKDWLVVAPDGRFNGSPGAWSQILWQFNNNPFDVIPVEAYYRELYKPGLLRQLLTESTPPDIPELVKLNRTQPKIEIIAVRIDTDKSNTVSVTVEVTNEQSTVQNDAQGNPLQSGLYDLRLFRDGQLVVQLPDATAGPENTSSQDKSQFLNSQEELASWRQQHEVKLDASGKARITFHNVHLPQRAGKRKVSFTAYAFNSDRVKSLTTQPFEFYLPITTAAKTAPLRRAYLITMGVNANQSPHLHLELAVSSAERARALLHDKLRENYQEVIEIPLYSDLQADSDRVRLKVASKANLRAVLDFLAGRSVAFPLRDEIDPKHQLQAATPDDAVVLYVASHGYADPQGNFYLMPYDTGLNWGITEEVLTRCLTKPNQSLSCQKALDLLHHSVSSSDLASWWSGVDAGEMVMILDSCHSGAAPGREFRPGPLGDPGLGQLSYDKGMQILSASQPDQTDRGEWVSGGQGRTLLVEALERIAKVNPQGSLGQWLKKIEQQLPIIARELYPDFKEEDVQIPLLLNFAKKEGTTIAAQ
jgi:WD40 repeat protein